MHFMHFDASYIDILYKSINSNNLFSLRVNFLYLLKHVLLNKYFFCIKTLNKDSVRIKKSTQIKKTWGNIKSFALFHHIFSQLLVENLIIPFLLRFKTSEKLFIRNEKVLSVLILVLLYNLVQLADWFRSLDTFN